MLRALTGNWGWNCVFVCVSLFGPKRRAADWSWDLWLARLMRSSVIRLVSRWQSSTCCMNNTMYNSPFYSTTHTYHFLYCYYLMQALLVSLSLLTQHLSLFLSLSLLSWATGDWGSCSRSCGGGQQTRSLRCLRKVTYQREEVVAHSLCPVISPAQVQPCHTQACPPEWSTGSWSQVGLQKNLKNWNCEHGKKDYLKTAALWHCYSEHVSGLM